MRFVLLMVLVLTQTSKPPVKDTPRILFPTPLAVSPGFKGKLTLRGIKLDKVTEVTAEKVKVKVVGKGRASAPPKDFPPERGGDSELDIELELPADYPPGQLELKIPNADPYRLTVDAAKPTAEKEPNNGFVQAQEIAVPSIVDAKFDGAKDVDVFRFTAKAGDKLRIEVQAARLGAIADASLTLYDADRRILDTSDDVDGRDPLLTLTVPRDGVYILSVNEANDLGGPLFAYRLLVSKVGARP